ncbi:hypothetical protein [Acetobacter pasteurianus]|uniref:hypothetical protein n=1 Tax=Acetobacter pasteurianus TaxID=438 RepID=UPI00136311E9|nr:hypothetical protein [Acetobacter pasteurianus]QHM90047.1 hypothetical protein FCN51_00150 [Acetobacter pasteurianus]
MGWKTFKQYFGIKHQVCVRNGRIIIGSPFVSDIASVDMNTGCVSCSQTFPDFLRKNYPSLANADPAEILECILAEDVFEKSVRIYVLEGHDVVEKFCEKPCYPNVTHDGVLIYDRDFFSVDRDVVVRAARAYFDRRCESAAEIIEKRRAEIAEQERSIAEWKIARDKLSGVS